MTDWQGKHVTVAGLGVSGIPRRQGALAGLGAKVTVVVDGGDSAAHREQAAAVACADLRTSR